MSNRALAWHLLRISLGLNFLMHGLVRLPQLGGFARGMAENFRDTPLPAALVLVFAYALPVVEASVGLWLLSGQRARWSLATGAGLMLVLEFGTALRSDWNALAIQMLYSLLFFQLLYHHPED